jgi:hypothetical protein
MRQITDLDRAILFFVLFVSFHCDPITEHQDEHKGPKEGKKTQRTSTIYSPL